VRVCYLECNGWGWDIGIGIGLRWIETLRLVCRRMLKITIVTVRRSRGGGRGVIMAGECENVSSKPG
jgi:hypothetical protein